MGDEGGLAAGRGAEVEDLFTRLGIERLHGKQGAGVLDVESAVGKAGEAGECGMGIEAENELVARPVPGAGGKADAFRAPGVGELGGRGAEGVDAGVGRGRGVVPVEKADSGFGTEGGGPALPEPLWVGETKAGIVGFKRGEKFDGRRTFAGVAAQEGVDEAGLGAEAEAAGEFDGFMNGGVVGDATEPEHLIEAKPEKDLEGEFLRATGGLAGDEPVERALPADGAVNEFLAETAIGGRQAGTGQGDIEQAFDVVRAHRVLHEQLGGDLPWIPFCHGPIMPLTLARASQLQLL